MKRYTSVARVTRADALLERIKHLGELLAHSPVNSRQHRMMRVAIRLHAGAYRKSLDTEQALATHDAKPQPTVGLKWLGRTAAFRKPTPVRRRTIRGLPRRVRTT